MSDPRFRRNPWSARLLMRLKHLGIRPLIKVWEAVLGVDLPDTWPSGLTLPHPYTIVVHGHTTFGDDCVLYQGVTIGGDELGNAPRIGRDVIVYAGACVIGNVTIGDRAVVGANAVVLTDVPADHVAVGAPARCLPRRAS